MSFAAVNRHIVSTQVIEVAEGAGTTISFLATGSHYPIFETPGVVDVSGMEFHIGILRSGATAVTQVLASAGSTFALVFGDAGTTATGDTGADNVLTNEDDFSNTLTGWYTVHQARKAGGTSTTDLDADDWVNIQAVANATGLVGSVIAGAAFIYGKPGAIN